MALGSSVGLKITFTMIGDAYNQVKATKTISYIALAFAISPGISIAIGGILTRQFGWESCFYFLAAYSLFILLLRPFSPKLHDEKIGSIKFEKYWIRVSKKATE